MNVCKWRETVAKCVTNVETLENGWKNTVFRRKTTFLVFGAPTQKSTPLLLTPTKILKNVTFGETSRNTLVEMFSSVFQ